MKHLINLSTFMAVVDKVVDDVFQNDVYNPAIYNFSRRVAIVLAYEPDFEFSEDNNVAFEQVYSKECQWIIDKVLNSTQGRELNEAIENAVDHRKQCIANSTMSMSDYALSKLIDVVTNKVEQIDTSIMNDDTIQVLKTAAEQTNKYDFAEKVIEGLGNKGYLPKAKPRATRGKNNGESE